MSAMLWAARNLMESARRVSSARSEKGWQHSKAFSAKSTGAAKIPTTTVALQLAAP